MVRAVPEHGTEARYTAGCHDACCRAAHAAAARYRRRMKAYGRHVPPLVPILASRRRVEALATLGWSRRTLSRRLGWQPDRLRRVLQDSHGKVTRRNHDAIARLYDELSMTPAPARDYAERLARGRALSLARQRGWAPPLAWDDETIADPAAVPHGGALVMVNDPLFGVRCDAEIPCDIDEIAVGRAMRGEQVPLSKAERSEVFTRLNGMGLSASQIGELLGVTGRTIVRKRSAAA